jgi:HEAT repeat protein
MSSRFTLQSAGFRAGAWAVLSAALLLPCATFGQTNTDEDSARSLIEKSLKDKNPETRTHAVQSLGLVSASEPYLSELEAMIADQDVGVRLAAITSLVDLKSERTIPTLRKALESDVPEVSFAAAKGLWTLNDPNGRQALFSVLDRETKTSSGFITRQKRDALRMMHTPQTLFLFAMVESANFAPVPGVGAGVSSLQGILANPGTSGRAAAALLLNTDRSEDVLIALQNAFSDPNWTVRAAAVHSIAMRNEPALAGKLVPLFEDRKEAVRVRAAAGFLRLVALGRIEGLPPVVTATVRN